MAYLWKEHRRPHESEVGAIRALDRMEQHAETNFALEIDMWWIRVRELAKQLCMEMGAYDTGTLHDTIRIVTQVPSGTFFEVVAGPKGIEVNRMLIAGGMLINPKTGTICNYAQSVHEGTGKNIKKGPRPFLEMAMIQMEPELERIMMKFMDEQGREWERD